MSFRWFSFVLTLFIALAIRARASASDEFPNDLVVDVRVFEARSIAPDFRAMEELAFFINTDGDGVTEEQWLATIARQATDSFLAALAFERVPLESPSLAIELRRRSRALTITADFSNFVSEGVFLAEVRGELTRGDEPQRSFEQTVEMRLGQTHVFSGRGWELSASEYLSHFRDYRDGDARGELYNELRNYTTFIVVAMTPRLAGSTPAAPLAALDLPADVSLPDLESPLGVDLVGTIELELAIDDSGAPETVRIIRSSIPEMNSQILSEAERWSFPGDAGKTGRLVLELEASP